MAISAMYPGTFDPITLGHEDLVRRAARLFNHVVVAIALDTGSKVPMFTFDERVEMAKQALKSYDNVEIKGYSGLTVEYARENGHQVIIRGLRAVSDFEYEFQLANMNRGGPGRGVEDHDRHVHLHFIDPGSRGRTTWRRCVRLRVAAGQSGYRGAL